MKKIKELREMDTSLLIQELRSSREEIKNLRFGMKVQNQTDSSRRNNLRKYIAQVATVITDKKKSGDMKRNSA